MTFLYAVKVNQILHILCLLWFQKIKSVKSSTFLSSIESTSSLFYRFVRKSLIWNDLQIRSFDASKALATGFKAVYTLGEGLARTLEFVRPRMAEVTFKSEWKRLVD